MKKEIGIFAFFVVAALVFCLLIGWIAKGNEFFMYKFFAPREEAVRREVFEESKAYRQGMIQELQNMMVDYNKTDNANAKLALKAVILHRCADYPTDEMPNHLRSFITNLRN